MKKRLISISLIVLLLIALLTLVTQPVHAEENAEEETTQETGENNDLNEETNNLSSEEENAENGQILGTTIEDIKKAFNEEYNKVMQTNIVLVIVGVLGAIVAVYGLVSPLIAKWKKVSKKNSETINYVDTTSLKLLESSNGIKEIANKTNEVADRVREESEEIKNIVAGYENKLFNLQNDIDCYKQEINNLNIQQNELINIIQVITNSDKDYVANGIAEKVNKIINNSKRG